jgi:hypothetical protein
VTQPYLKRAPAVATVTLMTRHPCARVHATPALAVETLLEAGRRER